MTLGYSVVAGVIAATLPEQAKAPLQKIYATENQQRVLDEEDKDGLALAMLVNRSLGRDIRFDLVAFEKKRAVGGRRYPHVIWTMTQLGKDVAALLWGNAK